MAQQVRVRLDPDTAGEGPERPGGVLGTDRSVALGAQDEVELHRPWSLAWLDQQQLHRRSMPTQRPDELLVLLLVLTQRGDRKRWQAQDRVAGG
ncbi:MAG TPA: hypothetical protein VFA46_19705 [Actinomycetes bacterium]|nr:hypothetical protein [Actinomycetes bacterium]